MLPACAIFTASVRSTTGKYCFHRCLFIRGQRGEVPHLYPILPLVPCHFWWYPSDWSQVPSQGYPIPRWGYPRTGYPQPGQDMWGVPQDRIPLPNQGWGTPQPGMGYSPTRDRDGVPTLTRSGQVGHPRTGTPPQPGMGYTPRPGMGYPRPGQDR